MTSLSSKIFLAGPYQVGQFGLVIERTIGWVPSKYVSSVGWTSYSWLGIRLYIGLK